MKRIEILGILLLMIGRMVASGQELPVKPDSAPMDSVHRRGKVMTLHPYFDRDTLLLIANPRSVEKGKIPLVYLPDSLIRDSLHFEYTRIKKFAYKTKLTKELYKMVFVNPKPGGLNVMRTQNSEDRFQQYAGKQIRDIYIKVLPPYGTSVYDTTHYEEDMGWLKNLANKTHMSSAESVIRRQLTIKPGKLLSPFELVQNEILLRQLDYIDDATFMVSEIAGDTNQVNLLVICKDQLSWGASVESNFINTFTLGLENKNFMKLGHVVNYELAYRGTKDKEWGNLFEYKVNSIWGSHINLRGYYRNDYVEKQIRIDAERRFVTSQMKWGGGVSIGRVFYSDRLPDRNVSRLEELFNYHFQDIWLGKSYLLPVRSGYNQNMYVTGRFFTTLFNHRPIVTNDTNHLYYNRLDYFMSLAYTRIKYYKANLIYDFGRTEDIPSGLFVSGTAGFEHSEFENYGYLGVEGRYAHFNKYSERFYSVEAACGAYLGEDGITRGVVRVRGNHISNLCSFGGNVKFRFYNDVNYIRGIQRYPADYLYMEDHNIRGFSSDTLRGNQKLSVASTITFFLPYIKKGFRFSVSSFVDAGIIAPENSSLVDSKVYWGIGVGVNLRNDNVVIKNLSLRFSFYPVIPEDGRSIQAIVSGKKREGFYNYHVTKPQVIQYQ